MINNSLNLKVIIMTIKQNYGEDINTESTVNQTSLQR